MKSFGQEDSWGLNKSLTLQAASALKIGNNNNKKKKKSLKPWKLLQNRIVVF